MKVIEIIGETADYSITAYILPEKCNDFFKVYPELEEYSENLVDTSDLSYDNMTIQEWIDEYLECGSSTTLEKEGYVTNID